MLLDDVGCGVDDLAPSMMTGLWTERAEEDGGCSVSFIGRWSEAVLQ